jgi:hypothetical protein
MLPCKEVKTNPSPTTQQTPKNNPKTKTNPNHNLKVVQSKQPTPTQNKISELAKSKELNSKLYDNLPVERCYYETYNFNSKQKYLQLTSSVLDQIDE